jgi:hypothetical protein
MGMLGESKTRRQKMAGPGSWIAPLFPAPLMLMVVALNHLITNQRNDRRLADETVRFRAALATELRALLDLYDTNLGLIARKADYILSTRSSVVVYKGNLGRLTLLLEPAAIAQVVRAFARNEKIEAVVPAHANFKCGLTYQFAPAEGEYEEWRRMYEDAAGEIAAACAALEGVRGPAEADEQLRQISDASRGWIASALRASQ